MSKLTLELKKGEGWFLEGKPVTSLDAIVLVSSIAARDKDEDLHKVLDYWVMLKESGHNGFYLKDYHKVTRNKEEAIRK